MTAGGRPTGGMRCFRAFGPLSLISRMCFFGREEICQGRPVLAAKRTLDRFPPFRTIKTEGKGAGGLRGLVPLAEYEAAPHARVSAPSASPCPVSRMLSHFVDRFSARLSSRPSYRHASIRTRLWLPPRCPLVFSIRGVLLSRKRSVESQSPGSRQSATTPQSPQPGAFAYLADSVPSASSSPQYPILLCRYFALRLRRCCLRRLAVVLRIVHFPRHPQTVQKHRQLTRHCRDGPFLCIFSSSGRNL